MERFFNTAGPNKAAKHYTLDPLQRLDWEEIRYLIDNERYFVLHAPRQTGKTSALLQMMQLLNQQGDYAACYANVEGAQAARGSVDQGIKAVCSAIVRSAELYLDEHGLTEWLLENREQHAPQDLLTMLLTSWSIASKRPIILFLDEVDALVGDTLISLLRQLRAGYTQRPEAFPQSIVLCGVRDVRDYRIHQGDGEVITGGSAFNIKAASLRLGNFSETDCRALLQLHTSETGQRFESAIFAELWQDTQGQPWLVNALAHEMTHVDRSARDRRTAITLEHYWQARERLIQSRATHLDQLVDKLKEPRVHKVISALLSGEVSEEISDDDQQYVMDLGLINNTPSVRISNRLYQEVIPRELTWVKQAYIVDQEQSWYLTRDHRLNMDKLLSAFQQFFRENGDSWIERFDYKEAGPQLLMQAFLQRIINGGGRISREYALGRKRTDLLIQWPLDLEQGFLGPVQRIVIELKIQHQSLEHVITQGIAQTKSYAEQVKADEQHLVIFNRSADINWDAKIWRQEQDDVVIWGC